MQGVTFIGHAPVEIPEIIAAIFVACVGLGVLSYGLYIFISNIKYGFDSDSAIAIGAMVLGIAIFIISTIHLIDAFNTASLYEISNTVTFNELTKYYEIIGQEGPYWVLEPKS